jgi:hypothetical protein
VEREDRAETDVRADVSVAPATAEPPIGLHAASNTVPGIPPLRVEIPRKWLPQSFGDLMQVVTTILIVASLWYVSEQVRENTTTNMVAMRGQLYATENALLAAVGADDLSALFAVVPPDVSGSHYARALLEMTTKDTRVREAATPEALYNALMGSDVLGDPAARERTRDGRAVFLYAQSNIYHMHNAFDYWRGGVLADAEWATWKGLIAEMNAHPVLLMTIWHGHKNRYFSRAFGEYLRAEICEDERFGPAVRARTCEFARAFYPEMFSDSWLDRLPAY